MPQAAKPTVEDFLTLDRARAFDRYGKTELLDGVVVYGHAQYSPHYMTKNRVYRRIADTCDRLSPPLLAWSEGAFAPARGARLKVIAEEPEVIARALAKAA